MSALVSHDTPTNAHPTATDRYSSIPAELREYPQWGCWRTEPRKKDGKPEKVPYTPGTKRHARVNKPRTWRTFDGACAAVSDYDGISYMFHADDPYVGIDLDDCRDPQTGELTTWAARIVAQLSSYTEVSPSGTGLHIIVHGTWHSGHHTCAMPNDGKLEIYDRGRYFTMTGQRVPDAPDTINARQDQLDALAAEYWPSTSTPSTSTPSTSTRSDTDVLNRARTADNGAKFRRLYDDGNTANYAGDDSRADLALCNMLAFWTGNDANQIDRLFRASALMRDKWDERRGPNNTYGQRTIQKAIDGTAEGVVPPSVVRAADLLGGPPPITRISSQNSEIPSDSEATGSAECPCKAYRDLQARYDALEAKYAAALAKITAREAEAERHSRTLQILNSGNYTPAQAVAGIRALNELERAYEKGHPASEPFTVYLPELCKGHVLTNDAGEPIVDPRTNRVKKQTSMAPATYSRALKEFATNSGALVVADVEDANGHTRLTVQTTQPTVLAAMHVAAERFIQQDRRRGPGRAKPHTDPALALTPACESCPPGTPIDGYCTDCGAYVGTFTPTAGEAPLQQPGEIQGCRGSFQLETGISHHPPTVGTGTTHVQLETDQPPGAMDCRRCGRPLRYSERAAGCHSYDCTALGVPPLGALGALAHAAGDD